MAIRFQINHPERMVVGVGEGTVTLKDLIQFARDVAENGAINYRRILDLMGCTTLIGEADVVAYRDHVRELPADRRPSGVTALVSSEKNATLSRLFTDTIGSDRPARVFGSIHEARKWLGQFVSTRR